MTATAREAAETTANALANDLVGRRFAEVEARFSPEVARALPQPRLETIWSDLVRQFGAVRELGAARLVSRANTGVAQVILPIRLERMAIDLKIAIVNGKIAGLFFAPTAAPPETWTAPAYVDPAKFTDLEVTVGAAPTPLGGTLSLPKSAERVSAVVLVHGSGPNDRDESIGANRPFRDLAEGLASRGVAALRYDKRTKIYPGQVGPTFTGREETIEDALAAVALLAKRPRIDASRIVIVGHSLGGTLAPRIVAGRNDIAGAVIMAGATRPLPRVIVEQTEYLSALAGATEEASKERLDAIKREAAGAMAAKAGDVGATFFGVSAPYWADLNSYDPPAAAARLTLPLLILQGGRDYQVTAADLQGWKAALVGHRNVTLREFPSLNHLFIAGEGKSGPDEYNKPGHVDPAVIEALAAFIAGLPS